MASLVRLRGVGCLSSFSTFRKPSLFTRHAISRLARRSLVTIPPSPDTLLVSQSCAEQIKKVVCGEDKALRVLVEGGGCSGFQYKFEVCDKYEEDDILIKYQGSQVVIDPDSLEYLRGSTVDYEVELIRSSFAITDNPKAETGCSCGASFSLKD